MIVHHILLIENLEIDTISIWTKLKLCSNVVVSHDMSQYLTK